MALLHITLTAFQFILLILLAISLILYHRMRCCKLNKKSGNFNNTIQLFSKFKTMLKISEADFVCFFTYNYSKRFIVSHFEFLIGKGGNIVYEIPNGELPVTSSTYGLTVLQSNDKDLHQVYKSEMSDKPESQRSIYKNINKFYYRNIFKEPESPIGYIVFAYEKDHTISEKEKKEIMRILNHLQDLL